MPHSIDSTVNSNIPSRPVVLSSSTFSGSTTGESPLTASSAALNAPARTIPPQMQVAPRIMRTMYRAFNLQPSLSNHNLQKHSFKSLSGRYGSRGDVRDLPTQHVAEALAQRYRVSAVDRPVRADQMHRRPVQCRDRHLRDGLDRALDLCGVPVDGQHHGAGTRRPFHRVGRLSHDRPVRAGRTRLLDLLPQVVDALVPDVRTQPGRRRCPTDRGLRGRVSTPGQNTSRQSNDDTAYVSYDSPCITSSITVAFSDHFILKTQYILHYILL